MMRSHRVISAKALFLALFLVTFAPGTPWAAAEGDPTETAASFFEAIADGLNSLGEKTIEWFSSKNPLGEIDVVDLAGKERVSRVFDEKRPGRPQMVSITHRFGEVRVETWDNAVVQVHAEIFAGAESEDRAQELADRIRIDIHEVNDGLEIRTEYPDTRDMGKVAQLVNCVITVPATSAVACRNSFGDTIVRGVRGAVSIDAEYGVVNLSDISGPVQVRARSLAPLQSPLQARNLHGGGVFDLRGIQAEFAAVSQSLEVNSFLGAILVNELGGPCQMDLTSDSGPIRMVLRGNDAPDIEATVLFGALRSDLAMDPQAAGHVIQGRHTNPEALQQVRLHASFGDIEVVHEQAEPPAPVPEQPAGEYTEGVVEPKRVAMEPGAAVVVNAIRGNVRIVATDQQELEVNAKQVVRTHSMAETRAAIEALPVRLDPREDGIHVTSSAASDMSTLGCDYYRVDLVISCPRSSPVRIVAADGHTEVEGLGGALTIEQAQGNISARNCLGALDLRNLNGGVEVIDSTGPLEVWAAGGTIQSRNVVGAQTLTCQQGKTVVDAPLGPVTVDQHGGDVRLIPLEGIKGDFNIQTENADIAMMVPDPADAVIHATAHKGRIRTSRIILVGGEKGTDFVRFQARPTDGLPGTYDVVLETMNGDIWID